MGEGSQRQCGQDHRSDLCHCHLRTFLRYYQDPSQQVLALKIPIAALKKEEFIVALNQMVGSDTHDQTYRKFGQQQIVNMFAQFGAPFSKATKVPARMTREVTK